MALLYPNISIPVLPLRYNEKENEFKVYLNDTGLLMALYGCNTKRAVLNNTLTGPANGGIYKTFGGISDKEWVHAPLLRGKQRNKELRREIRP
jgi:hypothetical protein